MIPRYGAGQPTAQYIFGSVKVAAEGKHTSPTGFGNETDEIRLVASLKDSSPHEETWPGEIQVAGYVRQKGRWAEATVQMIPVKERLFSRSEGLLETDLVSDKKVFVIGEGSGGATITMELAKCAVEEFILMDHDRLEVGNVNRHIAGIEHVGRYKTKFMADAIRSKNPYAEVETIEEKVSWENMDMVREEARSADVVLCCTDNRVSRRVVNEACVCEETTCILAGVFSRARGGQIHVVHPNVSPCYECFLMTLPDGALPDQEISSAEEAEAAAYSDRPVEPEPGLSTDILPVSQMMTKIALQELLKGKVTGLRSLDEDLAAPWYIWLNRREKGSQYEDLEPLGYEVDGFRICRWYGIHLERNPACPVCGNFEGELAKQMGIELNPEDGETFPPRGSEIKG
jgi:molybdopterin/thiamine biosynthesis adenylyltransferase